MSVCNEFVTEKRELVYNAERIRMTLTYVTK